CTEKNLNLRHYPSYNHSLKDSRRNVTHSIRGSVLCRHQYPSAEVFHEHQIRNERINLREEDVAAVGRDAEAIQRVKFDVGNFLSGTLGKAEKFQGVFDCSHPHASANFNEVNAFCRNRELIDRTQHSCLFPAAYGDLPDLRGIWQQVVNHLAIRRLLRRPSSLLRYLHRLASFSPHSPDFQSAGASRSEIDPFAVMRHAGCEVVGWFDRKAVWH